jgi:predicted transporter
MNNGAAETTAWVITLLVFVAIAFDVFIGFRRGQTNTISHQLLSIGQRYPILPLAIGVLLGHIFWPQASP